MTDLDPLASPPPEDLPARAGRDQRGDRPREEGWMDGPTGHAPTTESAGDPDRTSVASGGEAGAAAGALAGTLAAGPVGLPIGAAAGAALGAGAKAADVDRSTNEPRPLNEPASRGTGPIDPATEPERDAERDVTTGQGAAAESDRP